jgi:hypothetical protein
MHGQQNIKKIIPYYYRSVIVFPARVYYPIDYIYMTFVVSNLKVWHSLHVCRCWLTDRISYLIFTFVSSTWGSNFIYCSDSLVLAIRPRFMPVANCLFYITCSNDVTIAGYVRQYLLFFILSANQWCKLYLVTG